MHNIETIVNIDPRSFIVGYLLDSSWKRAIELQHECSFLLGVGQQKDFREKYPSLSSTTITNYMEGKLSDIVEGNREMGYRLKTGSVTPISRSLFYYSYMNDITMYEILGKDMTSAFILASLNILEQNTDMIIRTIAKHTKVSDSSVTRNMTRLHEVGIVNLETYSERSFRASGDMDCDDIGKEVLEKPHATGYDVGVVYDVYGTVKDSNRNVTWAEVQQQIGRKIHETDIQAALRFLSKKGLIQPSSPYIASLRRSTVNISKMGRGFLRYYNMATKQDNLPAASMTQALHVVERYNDVAPRRKRKV